MNTKTETHLDKDVYTIITNRIIELLESGTIPWRKPWQDTGIPQNLITRKSYKGINVWLLSSLNYSSCYFLTWKQVHDIGGTVIAGEKSHLVVFWKWISATIEEQEENKPGAKKKVLLRYYRLFNVEQCTGIPASKIPTVEIRNNNPIEICEEIVEKMPNAPVIYYEAPGAFYHVLEDYINMPKRELFFSSEAYYATLFHEMIHSTGHKSRLNRIGITEHEPFGSKVYSFEELVAEMGACFLTSCAGIENLPLENNAAYIQSWLHELRNDKKLVVYAGSYAQKATDYILGVTEDKDKTELAAIEHV